MISRPEKDEIINRVAKKAGDYEELYLNCAQGTLQALQEEFNLEGTSVLKAVSWMPGLGEPQGNMRGPSRGTHGTGFSSG